MARSDLLVTLVKASAAGDKSVISRTVEAMVAEERSKQHNVLADRLESALRTTNGNGNTTNPLPFLKPNQEALPKARDFVLEVQPRRHMEDLILSDVASLAARQLIEEQERASVLRSHSLEPRHRLLLVGPPGNGKTSLAEAVAQALAVPFFVVRYEALIGSFLGETAGRLKRVFDYVKTTPCVLFFDEFDAVGKERGDTHETGEIKRVVTSLLMQMDDLPSYVVIIAATNHAELLDSAVWRRFQLQLVLPAPSPSQLIAFIRQLSDRTGIATGLSAAQIVKVLGAVSFSEAEDFFLNLARRQVLSLGERTAEEVAREQLRIWSARVKGMARKGNKGRARTSNSQVTRT